MKEKLARISPEVQTFMCVFFATNFSNSTAHPDEKKNQATSPLCSEAGGKPTPLILGFTFIYLFLEEGSLVFLFEF
jgi:hypothetical protein